MTLNRSRSHAHLLCMRELVGEMEYLAPNSLHPAWKTAPSAATLVQAITKGA